MVLQNMALSKMGKGMGIKFAGHHIFYLAFAEDLVLLSASAVGLQSLLNDLERYCLIVVKLDLKQTG